MRHTIRSGALLGDGDLRLGDGTIGIDAKLHSTNHKTVSVAVDVLDKARQQGCIVVVTLASGRKFALAELDLFLNSAREIAELPGHEEKESSQDSQRP